MFNPATGEQTAEVLFAEAADVDDAVSVAAVAATGWADTSLARRAETLFRLRAVLDAHREDIARLITQDHGKVLADAMGEVARGIENVDFACGIASNLAGRYAEQASSGVDVYSMRQPLGVVAGITPFNFPAMVPMWMFANAIACGNAFILKPSEKDPHASVLIAEMLAAAGIPDGVFNVVHGDRVAVERIIEHPTVAAISFVGSTPVARHVYETATRAAQARPGPRRGEEPHGRPARRRRRHGGRRRRLRGVRIGGRAVHGDLGRRGGRVGGRAADRRHRRSGCPICASGTGPTPSPRWGRSSPPSTATRWRPTSRALRPRGRRWSSTGANTRGRAGRGFFLGASLIDDVTPEMDCYRDEIFGPVLSVVRAETYESAIELVNANPWGNGAAIFTPRRRRGPALPVRGPGGHGRRQRARSPSRSATSPSAGGSSRSSVTPTSTVPRASTSTRAQGRDEPVARPRDERDRPRVPEEPVEGPAPTEVGCRRYSL